MSSDHTRDNSRDKTRLQILERRDRARKSKDSTVMAMAFLDRDTDSRVSSAGAAVLRGSGDSHPKAGAQCSGGPVLYTL